MDREHLLLLQDEPQRHPDVQAEVLPLVPGRCRGLLQELRVAQREQVRVADHQPPRHRAHPSSQHVLLIPRVIHGGEVRKALAVVVEPVLGEPLLEAWATLVGRGGGQQRRHRSAVPVGPLPLADLDQGDRRGGGGGAGFPAGGGADVVGGLRERVKGKGPGQGLARPLARVLAGHAAEPEVEPSRRLYHVVQKARGGSEPHEGVLHHAAHDVGVVSAVPPPEVVAHQLAKACVRLAGLLVQVGDRDHPGGLTDHDDDDAGGRVVRGDHSVVDLVLHARRLVLQDVNALLAELARREVPAGQKSGVRLPHVGVRGRGENDALVGPQ